MKTVKGWTHLSYMEMLRELRLQSLEKTKLKGDFINVYRYQMGGWKNVTFQWCPARGKRQ